MHLALFRLDPLVTFVPDLQRSTGFSFYHFGLWFDPISIFAQVLSLFLFHPFFLVVLDALGRCVGRLFLSRYVSNVKWIF